MWWNQPFYVRLATLLGVLALAALWDWRRNGPAARRWREYLLLIVAGVLGAACGVLNDLVTANHSPDYFIWGKDVRPGALFWPEVLAIAFEAGFIAGALIGGVLLATNTVVRSREPLPLRQVSYRFSMPVLWSFFGALCALLFADVVAPINTVAAVELEPTFKAGIHQVWCMHVGLYAGAVFGTLLAAVSIYRRRSPRLCASA